MEEKYIISETYVKENESLYFKFVGKETKGEKYEMQTSALLDSVFNKVKTYQDIRRTVLWLRTILKDYKEEYLKVTIQNKQLEVQVEYRSKKLVSFEAKKTKNEKEVFNLCYTKPLSNLSGSTLYIEDKMLLKDLDIKIKEAKNLISSLEEYRIKEELYLDEQHICDVYKLFYGQNPNLTKKETEIRIQAMFYILNNFLLDFSYEFNTTFERTLFPYSLKLEQTIENLTPFGEIPIVESEIKIQDFYKRKIKMIGENVRNETKNEIIALMQFCKVLHEEEKELRYVNMADYNKISEKTELELAKVLDYVEFSRNLKKQA